MEPYSRIIGRILDGGKAIPHYLVLAGSALPAIHSTLDFGSSSIIACSNN